MSATNILTTLNTPIMLNTIDEAGIIDFMDEIDKETRLVIMDVLKEDNNFLMDCSTRTFSGNKDDNDIIYISDDDASTHSSTHPILDTDEDLSIAIAQSLATVNPQIESTKSTKSITPELSHAKLELIDPTPDLHQLFQMYNNKYFFGCLFDVVVRWGPKLKTCAGICKYEGQGGLCSISLNKRVLQYRPRKDLVSTLLHEMIHAYLFVTERNVDRDGHGPTFLKEAKRISTEEKCKITTYHSFREETLYVLSKNKK